MSVQIASFSRISDNFDIETADCSQPIDEALESSGGAFTYLFAECPDLGLWEWLAGEQNIDLVIEALDILHVEFSFFFHAEFLFKL